MSLPMNSTPTYNLTIPSTNKNVKFRPFLVKEEKALLIAQQSEDANVMVDTLKDIIAACVIDDINTNDLATFDIEYIFAQIRARSVGEIIELIFSCDDCEDTKAKVKVSFDLTKLVVDKPAEHQSTIMLFDDVGIKMKYPDLDVIKTISQASESDMDQVFDIIIKCIDCIFNSDEIFYAKEQSKEELSQFLENLTSEQFSKIQQFFETMPRVKQDVDYKCPVCGKEHHKVLEGINSFF